MFCIKCGAQLDNGAKFCNICGCKIEEQPNESIPEFTYNKVGSEIPENSNSQPQEMPVITAFQPQQHYVNPMTSGIAGTQTVEQNSEVKKKTGKVIAIIAGIAGVAAAAAIIVILILTNTPEKKVQNALANTIETIQNSDNVFNQELGWNSIKEKIENSPMQHSFVLRSDDEGADFTIQADMKSEKLSMEMIPYDDGMEIADIVMYLDTENIMVGVEEVLDDYLYLNFEELKTGFANSELGDLISDEMGVSGVLNSFDIDGTIEDLKLFSDDFLAMNETAIDDFIETFIYEEIDSKSFKIGRSSVDCDGYKVIISVKDFRDLAEKYIDFIMNHEMLDSIFFILVASGEGDIRNEIEDEINQILDAVEEAFDDDQIEIEIYLNDGNIIFAGTSLDLTVYGQSGVIELSASLLGEDQISDDMKLELYAESDGYKEGFVITLVDETEDTEDTEVITCDLVFIDDGYEMEAMSMEMTYERDDDELVIAVEDKDSGSSLLIAGRFNNIVEGESFEFELEDVAVDHYDAMEFDEFTYSVEPCDDLAPFVDYSEAKNILDIDEDYLMEIAEELEDAY